MHQHPRAPPATASPANSPRTNPTRTNNPREQEPGSSRPSSHRSTPSEQGIGITEPSEIQARAQDNATDGKDNLAKLSQVVQNYYTKAALIILQSRVSLPVAYAKGTSSKRVNKWFNVELDETDVLREDLRIWKSCDVVNNRPPPMIIETYIDTEELTNNQSLAIVDDLGKRWDVEEALRGSLESTERGGRSTARPRVVLERWHLELGESTKDYPKDLGTILPRIYKNSIVLFRSLVTYAKLLPTWKLGKRLSKPRSSHAMPKLKFRIIDATEFMVDSDFDELSIPLFETSGKVTEDYSFGSIDSPAGPFSISVTYRSNCDFRIDNSEALLSSHFMGMDEDMFEPSLGQQTGVRGNQQAGQQTSRRTDVGSLPQTRGDVAEIAEQGHAYGSLSTFHNVGARVSSSPLSALRAARELNMQSPSNSPPLKVPPNHRSAQGSRSSLRSADGAPPIGRRPSVSFMPFKSPSLSASPLQNDPALTSSPRGSLGRASALSALAEARNPSALGQQNTLPTRTSPVLPDAPAPSSLSSSPRPAPVPRYSSSFGHRRNRLSVGGGSKTDDDNNSSGKASITSSSAQPGSGVLPEGGGTSSGSIQTDDDNISDFLKMLDQKKDLKSFQTPTGGAAAESATRRTTAALSKFQRMRDSNAALSDSMSSSLLLHRSSSSSSRQLSSVPPMIAGTSISTSSSPGKPISPHTPHTPAIPSRLSANSTVEYNPHDRSTNPHRLHSTDDIPLEASTEAGTPNDEGTGAIDIPTSPRPFHPGYRRSSSVAQQHRPLPIDDDLGDILPFGMRSASLGDGEERPPLNLNALIGLQEGPDPPAPNISTAVSLGDRGLSMTRQRSSSSQEGRDDDRPGSSRSIPYRPRLGRYGGRGQTPPPPQQQQQGSPGGMASERASGSGSSDQRVGRYSFTRPPSQFEDEEPLLFAMSDFGAGAQRRSLEEGRGGRRGG